MNSTSSWSRALVLIGVLTVLSSACAREQTETPAGPATPTLESPATSVGRPLSRSDIQALAAEFADNLLAGGQVAPRLYRWVNEKVAIFLQFDRPKVEEATQLRYVGLSVKGVFCAEAQPGGPNGGFTHFHRLTAPEYAQGHGGPPGEKGYWLLWMAVDDFEAQGRQVTPGVDYAFSPTPPPPCGADVPAPDFQGPGQRRITKEELDALATQFRDNPLTGGQVAPRLYRWVNENLAIFLQFDRPNPTEATTLRYIGISPKGTFCKSTQPHTDFTHFHRTSAPEYQQGHGGPPGQEGFWLAWLAVDEFDAQGRKVTPGVDREFSPTPPPEC